MYKTVKIKWIDSKRADLGWEYLDDLDPVEPVKCCTVGFLIDDHEDYKTIAPTIGGDQCLGRITIPTCSILSCVYIDNNG